MRPPAPVREASRTELDPDPCWYKTGVIYELHVRAFQDSDGNGVGDFRGLAGKLDYLQELGVTALWLLPFYASPLRDDGYDIADYREVHPQYGTLADFRLFLREAHRRGLRVITELVLNHTSDQHPWFQRARRSRPGSRWRNYYVWSQNSEEYRDARVIFKDVEVSNWTWDPVARAYFWHRFFSHQPDLNYGNPEVFEEMIKVLDYWLDLGVDGLRLDAVPYLFEREGTSCENLPETHEALRRLRAHVDGKYGDRMLLAEANQWPEDAAAYLGRGSGDECHMAFHFPLMPRLFMALRLEDRTPILDILEQTPPIPDTAQWALFLRNHDELTLEMVTDEERDYMYRMYAQVQQARLNLGIRRRLAPLLGNDRRRIELLNALLFSLPGTPVLYYGDEIGMGDNVFLGDRNGVRTPMQWSSDKNAGFSRANPQALYLPIIYDPEYHYEAVNVEGQLSNPHSLLWWMRRLLALRKKWRALGEGRCEFLQPDNRKILSYVLRDRDETLLVVANLSRFVQPVELDLAAFRSCVPVELFGRAEFPAVTERPYPLTLGPHSFYWFSLEPRPSAPPEPAPRADAPRAWTVSGEWPRIFQGGSRAELEARLPGWLRRRRWFGGTARALRHLTVKEAIPVPREGEAAGFLTLVQADYLQGDPELYSLPLAFALGEQAVQRRAASPDSIVADLELDGRGPGVLYDAMTSPDFGKALLDVVINRRRARGLRVEVEGTRSPALRHLLGEGVPPPPVTAQIEQSNSLLVYGDRLVLKLFRRLEAGPNPDLEIGRFLTERGFPHAPPVAGAIECPESPHGGLTWAVVGGYVPNARDAWTTALDALGRYYDRVIILDARGEMPRADGGGALRPEVTADPPAVQELMGTFLEAVRRLGERTAALHVALASEPQDPAFAPEPFTPHHVRGLFQSMRSLAVHTLRLLRQALRTLPEDAAALAQRVLAVEAAILARYRPLVDQRLRAGRIRIHGDYHLGQALWTGKDFVLLDFEGEAAKPLSERRIKRSPLRDVAGMIRSLDYAAHEALRLHVERGSLPLEHVPRSAPWTRFWHQAVSAAFLQAYLRSVGTGEILPAAPEQRDLLLQAYLLNRGLQEIGFALNHRPAALSIPLEAVLRLAGVPGAA